MELRARTHHFARLAAFTAAIAALLALVAGPATAVAAKAKKRYPVVSSVTPMNAKVGDTISIKGRYFVRGRNKNTVVFKADGQRAVFAKKTLGTAKLIRVVVPEGLRSTLVESKPTRVRVRVLAERFGKTFTAASKSPRITAEPLPVDGSGTGSGHGTGTGTGTGTTGDPTPPAKVCPGDEDGDMLTSALENSLGMDSCKADSDGDGVPDGYEYWSARDLNDDEYQEPATSTSRTRARGPTRTRCSRTRTSTTTVTASTSPPSSGSGTATAPSRPAACWPTATASTTPTASSTR